MRTIVKCYNAEDVLKKVEDCFLVSHAREQEEIRKDKQFFINEEARLQKEFEEELEELTKQRDLHLSTIEEEEESKDLKELKKNKSDSDLPQSDENSYSTKLRNGNKKKQLKSI
tara:strand:+ start:4264 stop:4605 length:342 start_codon:yes stop_codon:yes gene_type:complete